MERGGCRDENLLLGALLTTVSVRWLGATEPPRRIQFYCFLVSTVMSVPIAVADWEPVAPAGRPWLVGLGMALVIGGGLFAMRAKRDTISAAGPPRRGP